MAKFVKFEVTAPILDYKGQEIKENEVKLTPVLIESIKRVNAGAKEIIEVLEAEVKKEPLSYRDIIHNALNSVHTEPSAEGREGKREVLTAKDKSRIYEITTKLFASNEPEFTESEYEFILERVDKIYNSAMIYGRVKEKSTAA